MKNINKPSIFFTKQKKDTVYEWSLIIYIQGKQLMKKTLTHPLLFL
jgi:hypothetical protein